MISDDFGLGVWTVASQEGLIGPVVWYFRTRPDATSSDVTGFMIDVRDVQFDAIEILERED